MTPVAIGYPAARYLSYCMRWAWLVKYRQIVSISSRFFAFSRCVAIRRNPLTTPWTSPSSIRSSRSRVGEGRHDRRAPALVRPCRVLDQSDHITCGHPDAELATRRHRSVGCADKGNRRITAFPSCDRSHRPAKHDDALHGGQRQPIKTIPKSALPDQRNNDNGKSRSSSHVVNTSGDSPAIIAAPDLSRTGLRVSLRGDLRELPLRP